MKTDTQYFCRIKDIPCKTVENKQGILLKLEDGIYYGVNEIGLMIWELLDGKMTVDDIISCISQEFDVSRARAASDVQAFLKILQKKGLIEKR